jgi:hypothetical protein
VLASRIDADVRAYTDAFPPAPREEAVPTWIADHAPVVSPHTDPAWRAHLAERYDYLDARLEERGEALATEPPAWAQGLGTVPEDERRADWSRLAAEVDLFRRRYGIDETEPDAVPYDYREKSLGAELQSRVTALHKSTVLRERAAAAPLTLADRLREQKRVKAEARLEQLRHAGLTAHTRESTTDDQEHRLRDDDRARGDDGRER